MEITTEVIKALRDETGVSIMQCKKALEEAGGDMEKAKIILRKASAGAAAKKSDRELGAGVVGTYVHGAGTIGSMVELLCETDFVSKNDEFQALAREIAMQVAATAPEFLTSEEITDEVKAKATEVFKEEVADKPENMQEQILQGKLDSFFKDKVLMNQDYIKDPSKTITTLTQEATQKFGERVEIGRFERFAI